MFVYIFYGAGVEWSAFPCKNKSLLCACVCVCVGMCLLLSVWVRVWESIAVAEWSSLINGPWWFDWRITRPLLDLLIYILFLILTLCTRVLKQNASVIPSTFSSSLLLIPLSLFSLSPFPPLSSLFSHALNSSHLYKYLNWLLVEPVGEISSTNVPFCVCICEFRVCICMCVPVKHSYVHQIHTQGLRLTGDMVCSCLREVSGQAARSYNSTE